MSNPVFAGRRAWRALLLSAAIVAALLFTLAAPQRAAAQTQPPETGERCFAETGFCAGGRILEYWEQNGGLAVFGYPLGPQEEQTIEGQTLQAQWFERARLELHPEVAAPYDVQLGRLGVDVLERQSRDWNSFPKSEPRDGCQFFSETGHNVCGNILAAWYASGVQLDGQSGISYAESLALFGLPLGDEFTEVIEGKEYTVQWFERARFELHPENQPPYNVLLGRLGYEARAAVERYTLPGEAIYPEGVAFRPSTGDFFVSSTSDGTIFKGNIERSAAQVYLPGGADGRTATTGLKVDDTRGRLFVSGAATGNMFVYDLSNGALLGKFTTARTPTFINDVAVLPNGDAFFTDSQSPIIYRVYTNPAGELAFEEWLNFTGTALQYQQGFNVNGIDASANGQYLFVIQSNTGKLFRIDTSTRAVIEVNLGGEALTNGDGILLDGQTLYVVRNQQGLIVKVQLADDLASGTVASSTSNGALAYPTTIAKANDRLLVVNSQFDKRNQGLPPVQPFTVASIPIP
jgi:sugar lactone lactonase YvrE